MSRIRIGVVRGGPSTEYEVSLRSGASVLKHLSTEKYVPIDILLTKNGEWIIDGLMTDFGSIADKVDLVWNALHGAFGEDGKIQHLFEQFHLKYTGSKVLPSAMTMNKWFAKEQFRQMGIRTPTGALVEEDEDVEDVAFQIFRNFAMPVVIKPVNGGSSVGVYIARTYEELIQGINAAREHGVVIVEEFIRGKEATCAVVDGKGGAVYALTPIEIIPAEEKDFFDYEAKYMGKSQEICPGDFTRDEMKSIRELASGIHRELGLRHYSRSDFIVTPRGIYALEVNTLPGLTEESLLPKALHEAGIKFPDFLDHIVELAMEK